MRSILTSFDASVAHPITRVTAVFAAMAVWLAWIEGWRQTVLWLLGGAFGLVLFHTAFSFAGGFRQLLRHRRGRMARAQLLMLALATVLILPLVEAGGVFGIPARGLVFPVGLATLVGAFLFGVGMQLGGGCGSGVLFGAGSGSARLATTLVFFIIGATLTAWAAPLWDGWPTLPPVALAARLGLWPALIGTLLLLGGAYAGLLALERRAHGQEQALLAATQGPGLLAGPWPLVWGSVGLAVLNLATVFFAGRPWAITAAFPLAGSKLVDMLGWSDPAFWTYWEDPTRTEALLRPLSADRTAVMDGGTLAGAAVAAALAGRFLPRVRPAAMEVAASCIGGLLLGAGAVIGAGCNISAWVGGTVSASLHGWVWILPALAGNAAGVALRPFFGLDASESNARVRNGPGGKGNA